MSMSNNPLFAALDRLDQALGRVEKITAARRKAAVDYAALDSRHARLRARVQDTIAQLDHLIADTSKANESADA
jgi:hypothetical protein